MVCPGQSSPPSSSDEDLRAGLERPAAGAAAHQGDTSTLESVPMVHRAQSFEYIPGESFPLQENSSSYEYLPGIIQFLLSLSVGTVIGSKIYHFRCNSLFKCCSW
jgi:hypothetical protein